MKQDQFDHTGIGAGLLSTLHEMGSTLHEFCSRSGDIIRTDTLININMATGLLGVAIREARRDIAAISADKPEWQPSVSLNAALRWAENALTNLHDLPNDCASDSDAEFEGALCDLALDLYTYDHAQDVYRLLTEGQG